MVASIPTPHPDPPSPNWGELRRRLQTIFTVVWRWLWSGWGAVSALGGIVSSIRKAYEVIWHRLGDADLMHSLLEMSGAHVPGMVTIVTNPFFGPALIIIGLVGYPLAISPALQTKIHKTAPIAGWGIFAVSLCLIISVTMFSNLTLQSGILTAKTSDFISYKLSETEVDGIKKYICPKAADIGPINVRSSGDPKANHLGKVILDSLNDCSYPTNTWGRGPQDFPDPTSTADLTRKGIFVPVMDEKNPDKRSSALLAALLSAGFPVKFSQYEGRSPPGQPPNPATIFISNN